MTDGLNILRTESKDDLARLLADISQDIEPENFIVKMYVSDYVHHTWDTFRYRRVKNGIMNNALGRALTRVLLRIQFPPSTIAMLFERLKAARLLSWEWLSDKETQRRVSALLEEAGLDYSAIEAEAYLLVADQLEKVDRLLKVAEDGRDRALRKIVKYRRSFAEQLERSTDCSPSATMRQIEGLHEGRISGSS